MIKAKRTELLIHYFLPIMVAIGLVCGGGFILLCESVDIISSGYVEQTVRRGDIVEFRVKLNAGWLNDLDSAKLELNKNVICVGEPLLSIEDWGVFSGGYALTVKMRTMGDGAIDPGRIVLPDGDDIDIPSFNSVAMPVKSDSAVAFAGRIVNADNNERSFIGYYYVISILIIVAAVLGALILFKWLNRNPWRQLERRIVALEKNLNTGTSKPHDALCEINAILSSFFGLLCGQDLFACTIRELIVLVRESQDVLTFDVREEIVELLEEIELVVFADLPVDEAMVNQSVTRVKSLIREYRGDLT